MARITSREIFHNLNGQSFPNFKALQAAVLAEFNRHVLDFPPGYTYLDVFERGFENGWIGEHRDRSYSISLSETEDGAGVEASGTTLEPAHAAV